ncbi:MAG: PQQ-binding-like beta-propeller repeat protein, partial [Candidatus Aenigmarchaeota archaeon]|nr:PQQ-binding-like beta-propeller repeat protein [Candidatus Aenigmarchaeota archaeon]
MSRYILDDFTGAKIAITNTLDKQFGDLELIGTLMEYKHLQKDYWEGVGVGGSIATAAAFWEDRIFFGACDKNFYCLDRNGKELWRFRTEGVIQCEAGVHDGLVFFGSQDRNVYAADCLTGELKWKFPTNGFVIGYVLVHKGIVYAVSYDGNVYALEEKTGMELWRVTTHWAQTCIFEKDDILYFGYRGGVFYAYDINARKFLWTFKAGQREISIWNGCFWGNNVYFGCFDGNIFALDRKTGNL